MRLVLGGLGVFTSTGMCVWLGRLAGRGVAVGNKEGNSNVAGAAVGDLHRSPQNFHRLSTAQSPL